MNNKSIQALAALVLASGLASQAKADILQDYSVSSGIGIGGITVSWDFGTGTGQTGSESAFVGGININASSGPVPTGMPTSYTTVCTDIADLMRSGPYQFALGQNNSYLNDTDGSIYSPNPSQVSGGLTRAESIFGSNLGSLGSTDSAAALQLAVWTELYSSGTLNINLSSGILTIGWGNSGYNITATGMDGNVEADLNTMLGDAGNPTPNVEQLLPDDNSQTPGNPQGLLYAPVPEASTVIAASTLLLSFGVCSLKSFSKKRA